MKKLYPNKDAGTLKSDSPIHRFTDSPGSIFFNKVTILGVGLIGASFALALKKRGLCRHIAGYGRKENNLKKALGMNIIDSFDIDASKACADSDLILFAIPVGCFTETAKKINGSLKKGAIVTDVGSVKGKLVRDMEALMPEDVSFVGGHPIAGSDRMGIDTAAADLFIGARCILTPTEKTDKTALKKIAGLWESFGSKVSTLDAEEHDRIYAAVSHLPHLIAYAIVNTVDEINNSYLGYAGNGFKDTTRIAASSPELWRDISLMNRDNILEFIALFKKNLDSLSGYLKTANSEALEKEFKKAKALREDVR
ncbi:MAG: prephenate dehydrogenase/arogenate dehydrogenase family protein [Nitrospirae bacterium]|nr:prephenate dehydrogenase/arogenate dehydrogenase family protein [Nitrospirota bacterium]